MVFWLTTTWSSRIAGPGSHSGREQKFGVFFFEFFSPKKVFFSEASLKKKEFLRNPLGPKPSEPNPSFALLLVTMIRPVSS